MKWLAVGIGTALLFSCTAKGNAQAQDDNKQKQEQTRTIRMRDACDPDSFNAAVGSGTCTAGQHGKTLFQDFIGEMQSDHIAGAWRFNPLLDASPGDFKLVRLELKPGDQTVIQNQGGETHTLTRVNKYGGGFIPVLNALSGNLVPAPECAKTLPDGSLVPQPESDANQFVEAGKTEAGPTAGGAALPQGVSQWQCCIHPWMRLTIVVKDHENEH